MKNRACFGLAILLAVCALVCGCGEKEYSLTTTGMGTVITQRLVGGAGNEGQALCALFDEIENASSLTKENSAAQQLNETGFTENLFLSEQAKVCLEVFEKSGGAFDFTLYPVIKLWGIGTESARVPEREEIDHALEAVDSSKAALAEGRLALGEGQSVDFGAVGKGYACDKAAEYLKTTTVKRAVIAVGGSLLFYGKKPGLWSVAIKNPFNENEYAGTFKLDEGFVSTSGSYERYFIKDGVRYHHIINPATGEPVQNGLASVTVIGNNGALTDALSTACFVLGEEAGARLLESYGFSGIFIYEDERATAVYGDVEYEEASDFSKGKNR